MIDELKTIDLLTGNRVFPLAFSGYIMSGSGKGFFEFVPSSDLRYTLIELDEEQKDLRRFCNKMGLVWRTTSDLWETACENRWPCLDSLGNSLSLTDSAIGEGVNRSSAIERTVDSFDIENTFSVDYLVFRWDSELSRIRSVVLYDFQILVQLLARLGKNEAAFSISGRWTPEGALPASHSFDDLHRLFESKSFLGLGEYRVLIEQWANSRIERDSFFA